MQRIIEVSENSYDEGVDLSLRPSAWDEYKGQEKIKQNLHVFITAAKQRQEPIDHILFFGPPGLGKTTLANIIATQMQASIKTTSGPMIEKPGDLAALLTNLQRGDILFIDEIHRLSSSIEEILYPAMEDFRLDIVIGSGPAAQTVKIDLESFTLIGATTKAGMISNPLRDRFGMDFRMEFYSHEELCEIIIAATKKLTLSINKDAALEIARRSRGTPRIALRLLKRIRDFSQVNSEETITLERTKDSLSKLGISLEGFDALDLKLLTLLARNSQKAIGLSTLAANLSEDESTIEDVVEPFLIAQGYIEKTPKGRIVTNKTIELLGIGNKGLF